MTNDKRKIVESIKRIDQWLNEKDITESRAKALMGLRSRYINFLDIVNCNGDISVYISRTDRELKDMREDVMEEY